ncbi:MAG TPA: hypothetical protein VMT88_00795 [Actinomycetes bacterium]|nr:hypothetical protein [Actinomycetes bacterium]
MTSERPDLISLLSFERPTAFDIWLDPLSPATALFLPYLNLDGLAHGGRPWRFRGHDDVGLRLLPDPSDGASCLAARCILAVRAWAVQQEANSELVPMDYDLPWAYLGNMLRDIATVRSLGLPHMVALAGREGNWLGDWVAEYREDPVIHSVLSAEAESARLEGVTETPTVHVGSWLYEPSRMPDDIADQVAQHLDSPE